MKKYIFLLLLIFLYPLIISAEEPLWIERWVKKYDSGTNEYSTGLVIDNNENVYICGRKYNGTNYDFLTLKYDSEGDLKWERTYNGGNDDGANDITLDKDGNVYVAGYRNYNSLNDYCFIKYSPDGVAAYTQLNGANDLTNQTAYGIAVDDNYNIYITGQRVFINPPSAGGFTWNHYCTIKYNSTLISEWTQVNFGVSTPSYTLSCAYDIALDNDNNIYITGKQNDYFLNYYVSTIKYSDNGNFLWEESFTIGGGRSQSCYTID
ncbi:MAG: hypothetical protein KKH98_12955, partial [Spirochaetes bacterium]|nr:hypothetical protein [Spirochaetota bacterium]